jgi:hypothetical protein
MDLSTSNSDNKTNKKYIIQLTEEGIQPEQLLEMVLIISEWRIEKASFQKT